MRVKKRMCTKRVADVAWRQIPTRPVAQPQPPLLGGLHAAPLPLTVPEIYTDGAGSQRGTRGNASPYISSAPNRI